MSERWIAAAFVALVASFVVLFGYTEGWHISDDIPPGVGAVSADGGIDGSRIAPLYEGRLLSPRDLRNLQDQGLAQAGVVTGPLACQGISLQFDTSREADAYMAAHPELSEQSTRCTEFTLHPAFNR